VNDRRKFNYSSLKEVFAIGAIKTGPIASNTCGTPSRCRTGTSPGDPASPRVPCRRERSARLALPAFLRGSPDVVCSWTRKNTSSNLWRLMAHLLSK
jgi:hypothetical protein